MARVAFSPAKLARPVSAGLVPRPRLFTRLDRGPAATWLCGPPGAGKTALVTSWIDAGRRTAGWYQLDARDTDLATFFDYLDRLARQIAPGRRARLPAFTPAFARGVGAFTRRFFEAFFERCPRPFTLVLDEYDALPPGAPLHEALADILASVPSRARVLVTSRTDPPTSVARLRATKTLEVIGWGDLRFTPAEVRRLVPPGRLRHANARAEVEEIVRRADGWAAGAVLLADASSRGRRGPEREALPPTALFDYFMAEVFAALPPADRHALLALSLLPVVSVATAVDVTESAGATELLDRLSRRHCFVEQRDAGPALFRFHPLFHQFLRAKAESTLSEQERRRILRAGAAQLVETGSAEDAAALLLDAQEWKGFEQLLGDHAPRLVRAGRSALVFEWLDRIPADVVAASPWLEYWLGTTGAARGFPFAREHLGRAAHAFAALEDAAALAATLAGLLDTFFLESDGYRGADPWIEMAATLIEASRATGDDVPPALVISLFRILIYRAPEHPLQPVLRDRLHVIRGEARVEEHAIAAALVLALHYGWVGHPTTAAPLVRAAREQARATQDVAMLQLADYVEGFAAVKLGDPDLCERAVVEGLERAERTGLHVLDFRLYGLGVYAARMRRDPARATRRLAWLRDHLRDARRVDRAHYHLLAAWDFSVRGDVERAYQEARTGLTIADEAGALVIVALLAFLLAQLAQERGDTAEAVSYLARTRAISEGMTSQSMLFMTEVVEADFAFARGEEAEGVRRLRQGLERARRQRLRFYSGWHPALMARVCVAALERGIEVEHVQELVRHHAIVPDRAPLDVPHWPWAVEIRALGPLQITCAGSEKRMKGKTPQRPLELLRALIAFGGRAVPAQRLVDALWPEADGDAGHVALDTNLLRLRRLLEHADALVVENGRVSLDESHCWVDAWSLELRLGRLEAGLPHAEAPALTADLHEALRLARGPLLADCDQPWVVAPRERLRRRWLRVLEGVGRAREQAGDLEGALAAYLRGLDVDDLAEALYQRAMRCYGARGRHAEALALYQRCQRVVGAQLGVGPSAELQAMAASLRSACQPAVSPRT
jgi:ATP/maltotriose-dependent transcriptional regulator MalT/DNA-binding SARP family transcriptional activator